MSVAAENISLNDCWQAGIDQVLAGDEEAAQAIWLLPFLDDQVSVDEEQLSQSLIDYLSGAVDNQLAEDELHNAYEITKCLYALAPENVNTLLRLLELSIQSADFDLKTLTDKSVVAVLANSSPAEINPDLLYAFIQRISDILTKQYIDEYVDLLKLLAVKVTDNQRFVYILSSQAFLLGQQLNCAQVQTKILEVCLEYAPVELKFIILCNLAASNTHDRNYDRAIEIAEECVKQGEQLGKMQHVCGSHRLLAALMEAGKWDRLISFGQQHIAITQNFVFDDQSSVKDMNIGAAPYFLNYLYDEPRSLLAIRNAIGDLCAQSLKSADKQIKLNRNNHFLSKTGVLKIGYIASTLSNHSVGWLSRWIFKYHNKSEFKIFIYNVGKLDDNLFNRRFFKDQADVSHYTSTDAKEIVNLIHQDEIDILVDLDSLSMSTTYEVMCHKPAPVTVTWLGWDTSGCPEVDYFIADPYVLPVDAEEYYRTKIWRLPQTYLAIDGFEIEVPTKRRSDYHLPEDSIVYLCTQKPYKHHPDIVKLQMQIIKSVPNSYLVIQIRVNTEALMQNYQQLADEVGISMDKLCFIAEDPDEVTHRANLQLADVVLDTFPYNGATTTLETLWMGVPMVTKVGQAFVARNSYAFMQQVGVTEGIAYTDAEYVDWGVKLGTDLALRQQVMGKLLHSRKTSPLWNARSFTAEMENAYRQMWEIYQAQILTQQK